MNSECVLCPAGTLNLELPVRESCCSFYIPRFYAAGARIRSKPHPVRALNRHKNRQNATSSAGVAPFHSLDHRRRRALDYVQNRYSGLKIRSRLWSVAARVASGVVALLLFPAFAGNGIPSNGTARMPPVVIDVRNAADARDVIHRAVQAIVEGQLVVFPTETVYGLAASALNEEAVARLLATKGRAEGHPLTLAVKSAEEAWDYVPDSSPLGRRLARRCWPGPVTLVMEDSHPDSLLRQLPASVQTAIAPTKTIGLRVPGHDLILEVLHLLAGPLALSSANLSGNAATTTAQDAMSELGDAVSLVLDDGESRFGEASSVVKVDDQGMTMLREGVVTQAALDRLASFMIVLVCTGNTCRSPLAEVFLKKRLAERLDCSIDQLEERGIVVSSAGIAAMPGAPVSAESAAVARDRGLDLHDHAAQPMTERLLRDADMLFTMTAGHRQALVSHWPSVAERTHLVCPDGRDVSDPIGGSREVYEHCANQIDAALVQRVAELNLDSLCPRSK